jgi:hypothetical protein
LNPIDEWFSELKPFVKRHWDAYAEDTSQDFPSFLEWCVEEAATDPKSAGGHFKYAGLVVNDL